jgi:membrane protein implicated in regulation of membrane protease activity
MDSIVVVFWYWWVLAFSFLAIEMLVPGFFFMWMAVSGLVTGCVVFLFPGTGLELQLFIFSFLSVLSIIAWRLYAKNIIKASDHPLLNKRSAQYIGRTFNLLEPIQNGQGKIKVDDSIWKVRGQDCDHATKVKVIEVEGTVLIVEAI